MQELDLRSIFFLLLVRIKWIVLSIVIGGFLFGSYAMFLVPEKYTSTAMLYMTNLDKENNLLVATSSNLSASERLVKTVKAATTAPWVLAEASERLDGALSSGALSSTISFAPVEDTSFLKISVTHTDPLLAQRACDVVADTAVIAFAATGETGEARVYQPAVKATKTPKNTFRFMLIGAALGALIPAVIIILSNILSITVYDKDDIQRRLNVPILGEIPSFKLATKGGKRKHV